MAIDFLYPQYEVVRNNDRCINCRACERQCANEVHFYDAEQQTACRRTNPSASACHRCVALCPTRALKIVKTDHTFKRERQLDRQGHLRGLPSGRLGRRAAVLDGQSGAVPDLLG